MTPPPRRDHSLNHTPRPRREDEKGTDTDNEAVFVRGAEPQSTTSQGTHRPTATLPTQHTGNGKSAQIGKAVGPMNRRSKAEHVMRMGVRRRTVPIAAHTALPSSIRLSTSPPCSSDERPPSAPTRPLPYPDHAASRQARPRRPLNSLRRRGRQGDSADWQLSFTRTCTQ